jgi:hypothetical protein
MAAEGMGHALRRAAELIAPSGVLVDIHPTPATAHLDVVLPDGGEIYMGPLHADDAHDRHARADAAIADALAQGLFSLQKRFTFIFRRRTDSLDELAAYVYDKWSAWFDDQTIDRARAALAPGSAVSLREEVVASVLRPAR